MKKRLMGFILVLILSLTLVNSASAQDYYFSIPQQTVNVYYNSDGTMALDYVWVFVNQAGGHVIDFIDVGMPYSTFDINSAKAEVDGQPVSVSKSDYQGDGFGLAIVLGNRAIPAGGRGTVHLLVGKITKVLYTDSSDKNFASGEFLPAYYGSQSIAGLTNMKVSIHLPPGVQPDEPRWHTARGNWPGSGDPQPSLDGQERVTYTWQSDSANVYTKYTFGTSFPKQYVPAEAIIQPSLWEMLGIDPAKIMDTLGSLAFFVCFGLIFFGSPIFGAIADRRRKLQYLPPKISIEGHGIKRGLTAVEAALIMQEPLDKLMTMILFGVLKKGAAEVVTRDPLKVRALPLQPTTNPDGTTTAPGELREYEKDFLDAFKFEKLAEQRKALQQMTVKLVRSTSEKMKGFSRKETVDYYKSIMERAWQQIAAAGTPEVQSKMYEDAMEWTMLDKHYDDRSRDVFRGPIFVPTWWHRYDPVYRGHMGVPSSTSLPSSGGGRTALPGADFAASVVGGVQNFAGNVLGNVNTFTSGVTNTTNPPPKPSSSGSRSGGGRSGGCACACACAGCACACAGGSR